MNFAEVQAVTFCPQLWDGFYINRMGEVYPCCQQYPTCVGNINAQHLREILNGPEILAARRGALSGTLECYPSCNLLDKSLVERPQRAETIQEYRSLRRLHISFGEACNIRCVMCTHPLRHALNPRTLDVGVVKQNVDPTPFEQIIIQGGEPLYVRECLEYMSYLGSLGKRYTVLTNGLLIDDAMARRLACEARVVSVSLNGATAGTHGLVNKGSRFERVLENIKRLRIMRKGRLPTITGRMTLTPENLHEIPIFLKTYPKLGFDRVNFGYVKATVPDFLATHPELFGRLRREIGPIMSNCPADEVEDLRLRQLGLLLPQPEKAPRFQPKLRTKASLPMFR